MSRIAVTALASTLASHVELSKSRLATLCWLIIGVLSARRANLSRFA